MKVLDYRFIHACSGVCLENSRASIETMHAFGGRVPESTRKVQGLVGTICPDCGAEPRYLNSVPPHEMPEYRGSGFPPRTAGSGEIISGALHGFTPGNLAGIS